MPRKARPRPVPETLQRVLDAALAAVEPRAATLRALERYHDLLALPRPGEGSVWVAAAGKAAAGMAQGVVEVLPVAGGTVAVPAGSRVPHLPGLTVWEASHPLPGAHSLAAAAEALAVARAAGPGDLLLCLLSGGASALWAAPADGVTLTDLATATAAMLRAGLPVQSINTVRKHLSRIGGGWLGHAAAPAQVVTLAVSDVIGSPLESIGSGPAVADPSTFAEALEVAHRVAGIPAAVIAHLQAGAAGARAETPKADAACFEGGSGYVIADNRDALAGAARAAREWGFRAEVVAEPLAGEARLDARRIAIMVRAQLAAGEPFALILGGETTVTVQGEGSGGRNQELALALAVELAEVPGWIGAALGTDGVDGPTRAAGARVDGGTVARGAAAGVEAAAALARNDSHGFFRREGGLLVTGPTGTNVADVVVVLAAPA